MILSQATQSMIKSGFASHGDLKRAINDQRSLIETDWAATGAPPINWQALLTLLMEILTLIGPILKPPAPTPAP